MNIPSIYIKQPLEVVPPSWVQATWYQLPATNTVPVFATAGGGGKILQVVSNVDSGPSTASTSSTSYVTTGMDLNITPSATSSKIYLTWTHIFYDSGSSNDEIRMTFYRDSTQLGDCIMSQAQSVWIPSVMTYVDSPSSTSQINYEAFFKSNQGNTVYGANASYNAVLTAWEIDGS